MGFGGVWGWRGGRAVGGGHEGRRGWGTLPLLTPPLSTVGWLTVGWLQKAEKVEKQEKSSKQKKSLKQKKQTNNRHRKQILAIRPSTRSLWDTGKWVFWIVTDIQTYRWTWRLYDWIALEADSVKMKPLIHSKKTTIWEDQGDVLCILSCSTKFSEIQKKSYSLSERSVYSAHRKSI